MKQREQRYIFKRSLGKDENDVEWFETIIGLTYKQMMKNKDMRKRYPLDVFKITPLYEEGVVYKEDPLNSYQLSLL
jgi:hypothetical protein